MTGYKGDKHTAWAHGEPPRGRQRRNCFAASAAAMRRIMAVPVGEQVLAAEAALWLLMARLILGGLPFVRALRLLGVGPGSAEAPPCASSELDVKAAGLAIGRATRYVPFRAVCLQQAFAALLMLRRRGVPVTIHLGLARDATATLRAHAWSVAGDIAVTGGKTTGHFTSVGTFRSVRPGRVKRRAEASPDRL